MARTSKRKSAVRAQPLIAVADVRSSSKWYQELLGVENIGGEPSDHDGVYDRLFNSDGQLILQLHSWDDEDHPNLVDADAALRGHGVLLWFEVDDFDAVVERVDALGAKVVLEPHVNPFPQHREIWLRDPDDYVVVLASPDGSES